MGATTRDCQSFAERDLPDALATKRRFAPGTRDLKAAHSQPRPPGDALGLALFEPLSLFLPLFRQIDQNLLRTARIVAVARHPLDSRADKGAKWGVRMPGELSQVRAR